MDTFKKDLGLEDAFTDTDKWGRLNVFSRAVVRNEKVEI
jgi:hypothetical protein